MILTGTQRMITYADIRFIKKNAQLYPDEIALIVTPSGKNLVRLSPGVSSMNRRTAVANALIERGIKKTIKLFT